MESLHPAQDQIAKDTHRFRVLVCGRKFGKTTLAAEELKGYAIRKDGQRVLYVAPTLKDAHTLMWDRLRRSLGKAIISSNETRHQIKIRTADGGVSDLFLGSWEIYDSYRGDEFDFIVFDEVQDYKLFWMGWMEAMRPTLTPRQGQALFMGTPKGFNHFYDLYNLQNENGNKAYQSFHFTSYDNPFIPKEEIEEAKSQQTEDRFAQEYLADFRKTEGLVYKEFDRGRHVYSDTQVAPQASDTILGIDFGYTNPSSIIPIRIDSDNHYWITEEWYKTGQTTEQIAEQAKLYKSTKVYADPAEPDRIEILRRSGLNVREVSKDIVAGVDRVRELFKQNRIHIAPDCKNLIHELETYRYPEKKPDQNEQEKPVKENDHALDALRYALYMTEPENKPQPDPYFEVYGTYYRD